MTKITTKTSMGDDKLRLNVKWLFAIDVEPGGPIVYLLPERMWLAGQLLDYPLAAPEWEDLLTIKASICLKDTETTDYFLVLTDDPANVGITRRRLRARMLAAGLEEDRSFTNEMVSSYV